MTTLSSLQLEVDLFAQKLKGKTKTEKQMEASVALAALKITWKT